MSTETLDQEHIDSFRRVFKGQDLTDTYIRFDGHMVRNEFLVEGWNKAIELGWLRVETVELEQETFMKGYLTEEGKIGLSI